MGFLISQSWQTLSKIKNVFALQLNIFILSVKINYEVSIFYHVIFGFLN